MEGNLAKRVSTGLRVYTVYLQRWREGRDLVTVLGDEIKINVKRVNSKLYYGMPQMSF